MVAPLIVSLLALHDILQMRLGCHADLTLNHRATRVFDLGFGVTFTLDFLRALNSVEFCFCRQVRLMKTKGKLIFVPGTFATLYRRDGSPLVLESSEDCYCSICFGWHF